MKVTDRCTGDPPEKGRIGQWISAHAKAVSPSFVQRALRFGLTTGLSAALSFGLPVALVELSGMSSRRAVLIGFVCAYVVNVLVLRSFVYKSPNHWSRDVVAHMAVNGAMRVLEYGVFVILTFTIGLPYAGALLIVLALSTMVKFFVYGLVFR